MFDFPLFEFVVLALAGFMASSINAVAGGGTFVTLPALIWSGLPSTVANASSTVGICPGTFASVWAYRRDLRSVGPLSLKAMSVVSAVGGLIGAGLLIATPSDAFDQVLPWLLLAAATVIVLGQRPRQWLVARHLHIGPRGAMAGQFALGVYGGYFGGAMGLMNIALWALLDDSDVKVTAPARVWIGAITNLIAVVCFIAFGLVSWPETLAVLAGALAGGYLGARLARRLPAPVIRVAVLVMVAVTTTAFFVRAYG